MALILHAADAERVLLALVETGYEAVQRHRRRVSSI